MPTLRYPILQLRMGRNSRLKRDSICLKNYRTKSRLNGLTEISDGVTRDLGLKRLLDLLAEEQPDAGKPSSSSFVGGGENRCWNDGSRRKASSISSCCREFDLGPAMYLSPNLCDLLSSPVLRIDWEKKTRQ
jgi:hypothetical protein